jgi:hypothetical protein
MRTLIRQVGPIALVAGTLTGCGSSNDRLAQLEQRVSRLEARAAQQPAAPTVVAAPAGSATPQDGEGGWVMSGDGHDVYSVRPDPNVQRDGHAALLLAPIGDTGGRWGTWLRSIDAAPYRGKRVRLSAYARTEGATKRAAFWARVQAVDSPPDGVGLGGHWMRLPATSDWTRVEIVLDVPPAGSLLQYGVGIAGPGKLWFDAINLEIVGNDVPVTLGS